MSLPKETPGASSHHTANYGMTGGEPMLGDPALAEALAQAASFGRLSDEDVRRMRHARRSRIASGAAGAFAVLIAVGVWNGNWLAPAPQHFETARGEQRDVQLADGTRLQLNGATSLDVSVEGSERKVDLRRGEVYFDVAHDAERPFVVHAGGSSTRVLGTAFDVDMMRGDVNLSVYRGKVRFGGHDPSGSSVVVAAGWRSRFGVHGAQAPTRFDATQPDWRQNWLDIDAMQLGDLVEALNRRGGTLIRKPPAELAALPLSGRFKLDDPAQLLGAIGEAYGFAVKREGKDLRLIRGTASDAKQP